MVWEGNGRSVLLERQGGELALKAGEAVIGDQGNRNSRKDSKENFGDIEPCQALGAIAPRPPLPMNTVIMATPLAMMEENFTPEKMACSERGSSPSLQSRSMSVRYLLQHRQYQDRADEIPAYVFLTTGRRVLIKITSTEGTNPIPTSGTMNATRANSGRLPDRGDS